MNPDERIKRDDYIEGKKINKHQAQRAHANVQKRQRKAEAFPVPGDFEPDRMQQLLGHTHEVLNPGIKPGETGYRGGISDLQEKERELAAMRKRGAGREQIAYAEETLREQQQAGREAVDMYRARYLAAAEAYLNYPGRMQTKLQASETRRETAIQEMRDHKATKPASMNTRKRPRSKK